ncbi:SWIM zinc finger family protein [Nocardioides sp. TF02-7]|uniref:SWIM zinc finger family protein n=1 Tax=Nocardioides sp. TF02-7 TaxID=2917724 RepID=UPI001F061F61|nr:SWIM zinc finger family protein [Nocardioides sp. TF02-7]UMG94337.1 SWIM zinc finger family protein [Nocardioides sp. TF02-7]
MAVPVLDEPERSALVDVVAAESGRVAALLAGDLPHDLVEHAEEVGVELLPFGGELVATCTCDHYLDPCAHALAVLVQVGWLVDADPLVLFAVRGLDREALLAALHDRATGAADDPGGVGRLADDVEVAADAVLRARRLVELMEGGGRGPRRPGHLSRSSRCGSVPVRSVPVRAGQGEPVSPSTAGCRAGRGRCRGRRW